MIVLKEKQWWYNPASGCWCIDYVPRELPDSFWISAGLKYDFVGKTVTKNNVTYLLPNESVMEIPSREEWLGIEGNSIYTYYHRKQSIDNLSGHPNVSDRVYYQNGERMYWIKYSWDYNDRIVKEVSEHCDGRDVVNDTDYDSTKDFFFHVYDNENPHVPEGGTWSYKYKGGSWVDVESIRKEIEKTRADENMRLKFVDAFSSECPKMFRIKENCEVCSIWIPANE